VLLIEPRPELERIVPDEVVYSALPSDYIILLCQVILILFSKKVLFVFILNELFIFQIVSIHKLFQLISWRLVYFIRQWVYTFFYCNYRNRVICKTTILARTDLAYVRIRHFFWHAAIS